MRNFIKSLFTSGQKCNRCDAEKFQVKVLHSAVSEKYSVEINYGCTICNACETTCPEVFKVLEDGVVFAPGYENFLIVKQADVLEAAAGCPCEVIKINLI